jgi:hypothetical protein
MQPHQKLKKSWTSFSVVVGAMPETWTVLRSDMVTMKFCLFSSKKIPRGVEDEELN